MNKYYLSGAGALIVLVGIFLMNQTSPSHPAPKTVSVATANTAQTPVAVARATTTSPVPSTVQDIVPGLYPNPIQNTATMPGIKIASIMVENNTDASGHPVSDHLQMTLQNLTGKTLSTIETYYTITDVATGKKEAYYKQLSGFTLAPHATGTVHFDGQPGYGHYATNMRGIYGTVTDQLKFTVEVSTPGYAPVLANATKAPGGAEVVGQ